MQSIIHICPQAGGSAVYRARALYRTVNDTIEYNDSVVCRQENYFREEQAEWEQFAQLKPIKDKLSLLIFPNPIASILYWHITSEHSDGLISIKDMMGKSLLQENVSAIKKDGSIDLSTLPHGLYLLHYSDRDFITTKKFVKQ